MGAKVICSSVYVVGRDIDYALKNDGYPITTAIDWNKVKASVDRQKRTLTLSMPLPDAGMITRTAIYNGDQGCQILLPGRESVSFKPVRVEPRVPDPATTPWPMGDAGSQASVPANVNAQTLKAAVDMAFEPAAGKTHGFLVVYDGKIIAERYAPGYDRNTRHVSWSMGKSVTAALIGILVGEGHFKVDDPAPVPEWRNPADPRSRITISHLLRMSSGLDFKRLPGEAYHRRESDHFLIYAGAVDAFAHSISRPQEIPPNTQQRYRNSDPLTLGRIVRQTVEAKGIDYLSYPQRALFDKIGARHFVWETDPYGNFLMTGYNYGTPRDWARFGLLHLQDGVWQGKRILPEGWVRYISTAAPADPTQTYGGLWWVNRTKSMKSLPDDLFYANGARGQRTFVIPSHNAVIVRMGYSDEGGGGHLERVIATTLAALPPKASNE
jgi:CubicO group peptidase (beta-lactamase class C family)